MQREQGNNTTRILCLLSGSLDSQLAACLLRKQGLAVRALTFTHPLTDASPARAAAYRLGLELEQEDITPEFIRVLSRLKARRCKSGDLCMVYHTRLLRRALERMPELGCRYLCTGSMVKERHHWQTAEGYLHVDRRAGCEGLVIRPLSGRLLPATLAEKEGVLSRAGLATLSGPAGNELAELAGHYDLPLVHASHTRCAFSDDVFARRVEDLCAHEGLHDARTLRMLRLGRHFRLGPRAKLVVGRNAAENAEIEGGAELYDLLIRVDQGSGPTGIMPFSAPPEQVELAAGICVRYSDASGEEPVRVRIRSARELRHTRARALTPSAIEPLKIGQPREDAR
jgi:hypothetical protein